MTAGPRGADRDLTPSSHSFSTLTAVNRHCPIAASAAVIAIVLTACSGGGSDAPEAPRATTAARASTTTATSSSAVGPPTVTDETVTTPDGRTRTYRVVVPEAATGDEPVPLLVALHGGTGSGEQFERTSGFDELAAQHGFIVVYPDGIEIGGTGILARGHVWNGGKCCGRGARENIDDVGFVAAVIDRVTADHQVDPRRIYAAGHSNGAIMSYRLACELSGRIVAIGVQAGTIEIDDCAPTQSVSVLAIHGLADTNIPIDGGQGTGLSPVPFSSPTAAVERFAEIDGCDDSTTSTPSDNPDVTIETWSGGRKGTEVQFVRVAGASHAWMGHPSPRRIRTGAAAPYQGFDSSAEIWEFLAAHPRPT